MYIESCPNLRFERILKTCQLAQKIWNDFLTHITHDDWSSDHETVAEREGREIVHGADIEGISGKGQGFRLTVMAGWNETVRLEKRCKWYLKRPTFGRIRQLANTSAPNSNFNVNVHVYHYPSIVQTLERSFLSPYPYINFYLIFATVISTSSERSGWACLWPEVYTNH